MDVTPLGLAVLADDVDLLDTLFAKGARWRQDTFDGSAMYEAATHGSPAMIKALLRRGLAPDVRTKDGWPGLMGAAWENRPDNFTVLLEAGADVNFALPNGISALRGAVMCKNQDMVDALIRHGVQADAKTRRLAEDRSIRFPRS
jgi:ankyrin repeat protein